MLLGEFNNPAHAIERQALVDLGHDLFSGEPVFGVVDHSVGGHTGAFHDKGPAYDASPWGTFRLEYSPCGRENEAGRA
jgi:hypothetical protein